MRITRILHLLTARSLSVFRGNRLVLAGVEFSLAAGGALLLRGPNGAGKSTLLRAIAGFTPVVSGVLLWDDAPAQADLAAHGARIAWLGHQDGVKPTLTVAEQAPAPALEAMGLARLAPLPARLLSAGQKRRLALARVVGQHRPLWLLDEPVTGLDAASVSRFESVCATHRAEGGMIMTSTHGGFTLPGAAELTL